MARWFPLKYEGKYDILHTKDCNDFKERKVASLSQIEQRKERLKSALRMGVVLLIVLAFGVGTGWYLWQDAQRMDDNAEEIQTIAEQVVGEPTETPTEAMDENLLRRIDFNALQAINTDATRWIYVPNTAIDSQVMQEQTVGHYEYDLKSIYRRYNGCGTFLVPAAVRDSNGNAIDDAHTLLLGHRMNNYNGEWQFSNLPTRWGSIDGANEYPYVYIYYPDHAERWRVWVGVDAWESDMIYDMPYELGSDGYQKLIDHVASIARYQAVSAPDKDTRTLMLSTCNRPNGGALMRFVLACVPDAEYYYDSQTYVDMSDTHAEEQWKEANASVESAKRIAVQDARRGAEATVKPSDGDSSPENTSGVTQ